MGEQPLLGKHLISNSNFNICLVEIAWQTDRQTYTLTDTIST